MSGNKLFTFSRTDLACERRRFPQGDSAVSHREFSMGGFNVSEVRIDDGDDYLPGRYVTVDIGRIWLDSDSRMDSCTGVIAELISEFITSLAGPIPTSDLSIMVAGLGNRFVTADSLGPLTADKLTVTRHMMGIGDIFDSVGCAHLSAIQPGVLGQTGIEAASIIGGAVAEVKPHVMIAVDALAARSVDRLATTVQISDSGIRPGSGIGNRRCAISKETVGCPVISLGVPTVVDSSTLVCDALERADFGDIPPSLEKVLENGRSFYVSPKDSDIISDELSSILAAAISIAIGF